MSTHSICIYGKNKKKMYQIYHYIFFLHKSCADGINFTDFINCSFSIKVSVFFVFFFVHFLCGNVFKQTYHLS